jgi:hypothetical protein
MNSDKFLVTGETGETGHYTVHAFSKRGMLSTSTFSVV